MLHESKLWSVITKQWKKEQSSRVVKKIEFFEDQSFDLLQGKINLDPDLDPESI